MQFQHTAARRRLLTWAWLFNRLRDVSTHSRPKAAAFINGFEFDWEQVSTHSRPKAAAVNEG